MQTTIVTPSTIDFLCMAPLSGRQQNSPEPNPSEGPEEDFTVSHGDTASHIETVSHGDIVNAESSEESPKS